MKERLLIVNADDFGRSPGINRGVIASFERGITTSASLMVRYRAAPEAAAYAKEHPGLSLGLHLDLGEWAFRNGAWKTVYGVVPADDADAVAEEASRQLEAFRRLAGKPPTHVDSHQHVHVREPVRSALAEVSRRLDVPLRHFSPGVRHCGGFHGQDGEGRPFPEAISVDGLVEILASLSPGVTELGCHPGLGDDLETTYRAERVREVETLCDPRVRKAMIEEGIEPVSFGEAMLRDANRP